PGGAGAAGSDRVRRSRPCTPELVGGAVRAAAPALRGVRRPGPGRRPAEGVDNARALRRLTRPATARTADGGARADGRPTDQEPHDHDRRGGPARGERHARAAGRRAAGPVPRPPLPAGLTVTDPVLSNAWRSEAVAGPFSPASGRWALSAVQPGVTTVAPPEH